MSIDVTKLPELIRGKKRALKAQIADVERVLAEVEADLHAEVEEIAAHRARGDSIIPELDYRLVREGKVPDALKAEIRRRGAAVVRNVFPRSQAEAWNEFVGDYLARNDYVNKAATRDAGDRYFTSLKSSRPQIFGIYWSKPQMEARQGVPLAETRAFLNRLWRFESGGKVPLRSRPRMHLCRPPAPARAGRFQPRPLAAHGCGIGGALAGSRLSGRSIARSSPASGATTIRSTQPSGPRRRRFRRRRCAAPFAPSRAGRP